MRSSLLIFTVLLVLLPSVYAATVQGTLYDLGLEPVTDAVISINSVPEQTIVVDAGAYQLSLEPGAYTIRAIHVNGETLYAEKKIIIEEATGSYIVDLILVPDDEELIVDDIESFLTEADASEEVPTTNMTKIMIGVLIGILIIGCIFYARTRKKTGKTEELIEETDGLAENIITIIKKEGGRITQKDLRKHSSLSEAKISLVISELEAKGMIQKIKKGRGNILLLKKKE